MIPCTPGIPPDECGLKVHVVEGSVDFTSPSGETQSLNAGSHLTVSGTGIISTAQAGGTILQFASTGPSTTGSIGAGGSGGSGGGSTGTAPPSGGSNSGTGGTAGTNT